jgi:hypothetical protein
MSHLSQMIGLAVQNFVSAGVGFGVIVAIIRGITRTKHRSRSLGNFWVDLVRGTVRILLPLSFVFAIVMPRRACRAEPVRQHHRPPSSTERRGRWAARRRSPVAGRLAGRDQAARHERRRLLQRQLGAPVREPERPITNLLENWAILVIPLRAGGRVRHPREGPPSVAAAARGDGLFLVCITGVLAFAESNGNPQLAACVVSTSRSRRRSRAATWRARRCASARAPAACGPGRPPAPPTAR